MNPKYLEIFNLDKAYETPKGEVTIVKGFNLTLREGEFVTLIGHSGCGKSTVLSIVAGLTQSTSGGVVLATIELRSMVPSAMAIPPPSRARFDMTTLSDMASVP